MAERESILSVLDKCDKCSDAECFRLGASLDANPTQIKIAAMLFRTGHSASKLAVLEHVERHEATLLTGEPAEYEAWEARYETPKGEAGQAFTSQKPILQN